MTTQQQEGYALARLALAAQAKDKNLIEWDAIATLMVILDHAQTERAELRGALQSVVTAVRANYGRRILAEAVDRAYAVLKAGAKAVK